MAWTSILPPAFAFIEIWAVRLFFLLGIITIGPWLLLLAYDAVLYVFRTTFDGILWIKTKLSIPTNLDSSDPNKLHEKEQHISDSRKSERAMKERVDFGQNTKIHHGE